MRIRLVVLLPLTLMLFGCSSVRSGTARLFQGEVYRVDTPWWDPRTEKLDPSDRSDSLINIATYCFPEDIDSPETPDSTDLNQKVDEGSNQTAAAEYQRRDIGKEFLRNGKTVVHTEHRCEKYAYDIARTNAISRDRLQDILIAASERECDKHKASVLGTNNGLNLGLSMLTSLLSGAATGFSATSTKTALSAASAFFGSSRSQINEQIYQQLFVGTILLAVDNDRKAQMLEILDKRRFPVPHDPWDIRNEGKTVGDAPDPNTSEEISAEAREVPSRDTRQFYGIDEAIRDAEVYHERCSFYNGIVRLATKVEEFSPCRMVADRRELVLAELTTIQLSGTQDASHKAKFDSYKEELKTLNTKVAACTPGSSQ